MGKLEEPARARALETIERNAEAQAQLIEDLLDVSRIISGKFRVEVRAVDLPAVTEAAIDAVRLAAEAKAIAVVAHLERIPQLAGDPTRLQQVVWNLLSNAIKFTGRGGLVTVQLTPLGSQVEVVVSDSGKGIAPEFLPHVFERFRQEDSSTTRRHGGLGLGLAIVRQLVELHGGTVRAESAGLDLGATFTVSLPRLTIVAGDPEAQSDPAAEREAVAADGDGSVAD
jgi:signal transduction histidine kinase